MTSIRHGYTAIALILGSAVSVRGQSFQIIPAPVGSTAERGFTISPDGTTVMGTATFGTSNSVWWWRFTGTPTVVGGTNIDNTVGVGTNGTIAIWAPSAITTASRRYTIDTGAYESFPAFGASIPRFGCMAQNASLFAGQFYVPPHDRSVGAWNANHQFFPGVAGQMNQGYALACTPDGTVAVGHAWEFASGLGQAFKWTVGTGAIGLGSFDPIFGAGTKSSATGVSADSLTIVGWATSGGLQRPCKWTGQTANLVDLGLPAGATAGAAAAVSADGSIIVGQSSSPAAALLWDTPHGMVDLRGLLLSQGVTNGLESVTLTTARAISADGINIVGTALDAQGITHAYVARLGNGTCYPNCDGSSYAPVLNANDFQCFLNKFAAGDSYANCDQSTGSPGLNANDFACFINRFAGGC